jgi:surfeit locus 1 family protein
MKLDIRFSTFNLKALFGRRWWKTTVVVLIALAVMVRLGIWQLDRLEQRRAFNARVQAQLDQPPLNLSDRILDADLEQMEYREVVVLGEYDHNAEVALRNQAWNNRFGVHLITPLRIAGSDRAILVDRGWIPFEEFEDGDWSEFAEPGLVEVRGMLRVSQNQPTIGFRSDPTPAPGSEPRKAWNILNADYIAGQVADPLLPVYIQQAPEAAWTRLPYRSLPQIELSEGPHLGYAIQWFAFALILGTGYPLFVRKQEMEIPDPARSSQASAESNQVHDLPVWKGGHDKV